jgi:hypothetical protein
MHMSTLRSATLLAALLAVSVPAASRAQSVESRPSVSLNAGAFQFDLSGTGTAPMLALRGDMPLSRHFLAEGSISAARPTQQFGATTFIAPEAQVQAQLPLAGGRVAPYLGAGAGLAIDVRNKGYIGDRSILTVSGATGLRYWLTDQLGLRGELRVRGIGTRFEGSAAEWTLGTSWRL